MAVALSSASPATMRPVVKALHRPLTLCGIDRRLFFLALMAGAATFNLFYSLLAGVLVAATLYTAALLATWQADHAKTPRVRAAMNAIAREEAEHALLGLRVAQWLDAKLDDGARARVAAARATAIAELFAELAIEPDETLREEAGLPNAIQSQLLARSLFGQLSELAAIAA